MSKKKFTIRVHIKPHEYLRFYKYKIFCLKETLKINVFTDFPLLKNNQ